MNFFLEHIWMIPLLPVLGALIQLLAGRRLSRLQVSWISVGLPGLSFLWAVFSFFALLDWPGHSFEIKRLYTWLPAGPFRMSDGTLGDLNVDVGFLLDPLSAVMLLVVTGVGFLIHVYSMGYMAHEGGYYRFFGYLNLFMFSMLVLILSNNYLMMFIGWEGVGLCSYLLIGFYFDRKSASDAGKKAFIVNRIGDAGFLLGVMLIVVTFGTLNFGEVTEIARSGRFSVGDGALVAICLLLFVGAVGKSAQIPLYVWLPDAMEGPTPVSALIHAATMVTAGVYMVARSNALYVLAPSALAVVAVIGALTAIWAASIALVQTDIKRVLAYSTVSQLGYMFLACGVGAFSAGIFHLTTHAFFKALLFLGSGSVIHAMSGEQDMRKMGGLHDKIPVTYWTFGLATLSIAGFPLLAGFISKDEILLSAFSDHKLLLFIGVVTAGLTAFYMFRLLFMTFWGSPRYSEETAEHLHESPEAMLIPLRVLAVLSVMGGFLGWPLVFGGSNRFGTFLEPVFKNPVVPEAAHYSHAFEYGLMAFSVSVAAYGVYTAYRFYLKHPEIPERWAGSLRTVYAVLLNKYYVDELYDALFVDRIKNLGNFFSGFDLGVIDGGVNGSAWLTRTAGEGSRRWDLVVIDGLVNLLGWVVHLMSYPVRMIQTGAVQSAALLIVLGLAASFAYYLFR